MQETRLFQKIINFIAAKPGYITYFRHQKFYSGFTLMEILIAVVILGLIMATILGTFTGIIRSSRMAEKRAELYQTGRAVMDLLSTDIRGLFKQPGDEKEYFFMGINETIDDQAMSGMDFITTNSLVIERQKNPFLSEVGYRMKKNTGEELYTLWRRTQSPPGIPYEGGGKEVPVCRIIEKFRLEFVVDGVKRESLKNQIPSSIIIDFILNLKGERERFVTRVRPMIS